jgi:hypothetical protein
MNNAHWTMAVVMKTEIGIGIHSQTLNFTGAAYFDPLGTELVPKLVVEELKHFDQKIQIRSMVVPKKPIQIDR